MKADLQIGAFLANVPMFRDASPEELDRIGKGTRIIHARRGELLFRKGDPCPGFHVVIYGQVKLGCTAGSGADKVVEIIDPGMSFGEAIMFLDKPSVVYAQTLADSMLVCVGKSAVFEELERNPAFALKMLAGLSRRLHGLVSDVEAYSLHSGIERVIGYLMREDDTDTDTAHAAPFDVSLPISKNVLASRLNLTPQHFSRILGALTEAGLIEVDGRVIRILDPARLRAFEVQAVNS